MNRLQKDRVMGSPSTIFLSNVDFDGITNKLIFLPNVDISNVRK